MLLASSSPINREKVLVFWALDFSQFNHDHGFGELSEICNATICFRNKETKFGGQIDVKRSLTSSVYPVYLSLRRIYFTISKERETIPFAITQVAKYFIYQNNFISRYIDGFVNFG